MNDSQSFTLNFFKIWADEGSVESDDLVPKPITATIDFAIPNENAVISGVTFGANINLLYDKAILNWAGPLTISVSDRTFSVTLSDVEFSKGSLLDADLGGPSQAKWVTATVRQVSHSVPDGGATVALLGLGIASLSLLRRAKA